MLKRALSTLSESFAQNRVLRQSEPDEKQLRRRKNNYVLDERISYNTYLRGPHTSRYPKPVPRILELPFSWLGQELFSAQVTLELHVVTAKPISSELYGGQV